MVIKAEGKGSWGRRGGEGEGFGRGSPTFAVWLLP